MQKNHENVLRDMPVGQAIARMSVPAVVTILIMLVYNMTDMIFLGRTGDPAMVAAVSLVSPFYMLQMTLGTLIGTGGCVAISRALGAGRREAARACSATGLVLCLAGGLVLAAAAALMPEPLLRLLGTDTVTHDPARDYLVIVGLGTPLVLFSTSFAYMVRAEGAAAEAVVSSLLGTAVNMLLDPLLILACGLGVAGAALATVAGNAAASVAMVIYVRRHPAVLTLNLRLARREALTAILRPGIPAALSNLMNSLVGLVSNHVLIGYGAATVAAFSVAGRADMVTGMVVMGVGIGIQPLLAYSSGVGDRPRLRALHRRAAGVMLLLGTGLTGLCLLLREPLILLLLDNRALMPLSVHIMTVRALGCPLVGLTYLATNSLQAADRALPATLLSLLRQGILYGPLLLLLRAAAGLEGVIWASVAADLATEAVAAWLLRGYFLPEKKA